MKDVIVLIEKDPAIAEVMDYILTEAGYTIMVIPPEHYEEAITSYHPQLIMLDYSINCSYNGKNVCSSIKSNPDTANIPVIIVSAANDLVNTGKACHANDVLSKPFDIADLEAIARKWLSVPTEAIH